MYAYTHGLCSHYHNHTPQDGKSWEVHILYRLREEVEKSLSSLSEEAGRREREWGEERERREATEQGLTQQVNQLQSSLSTTQQEKSEASLVHFDVYAS